MKNTRIALILALSGACSLASAAGTESASITVNATVPGVCKLTSSNAVTVNITANPSIGGDATGTAPVTFKCTKKHPYSFSVSQGATSSNTGTLAGSLSDGATTPTLVPFAASWTQPSGTGAGFSDANAVSADVLVTITEANYIDAPAGSYAADLTVKIDY